MKLKIDWRYARLFVGMFLVELVIALFVRDAFIRPFVGDALVVVLLYLFFRSFLVCDKAKLVTGVLVFAWAVEVGQYFNLVDVLGLQGNRVARVVIGSTFDVMDLLAYTLGAGALMVPDVWASVRKKWIRTLNSCLFLL
ncbi:DUF2809 domain-containing protein [Desulfoluna butyratoxydans]|uniref:DUF2809 domain-containing protein n=1 Tax=Desulfoluna butyratoxydans TaxID=231438 RepID=A0A4U8YRT1_9BACT|nr:DUF2809 domain-containing protein [Desulfoluna butyratoxydans]VFQ46444.1 protein of unknown function duf2809 [Desulfoluna butyratoxydans]